jgi:chromosome segregation ATPase
MKGVALQNKEAHQALQQPVLTAQRDYLSEKLEFEAYKLRMEKRFRLLYILLFSLVIVMVVYVLSRKLKKEKEKARKTIDELNCEILHRDRESRHKIDSLLEELEEQDKSASASIQGLRSELQRQEEDYHRYIKEAEQLQHELQADLQEKSLRAVGMFRESISTMGEIMLDFEEIKAPNTQVENIIQQWKKKYFVGAKALGHLEKLVNEFHDDAMVHFRREVRLRSDADYQQVCCLFAGISVKVTAWLMNKNENTVYHWRQRLYDKIKSSDFEYKNLYLKLIDK